MRSVLLLSLLLLTSWKIDNPQWLFVLHASSGEIKDQKLTLDLPSTLVVAFQANPKRKAKIIPLNLLIKNWEQLFLSIPAKASISAFGSMGEVSESLMILKQPEISSSKLKFSIKQLGEPIDGKLGELALFISGIDHENLGLDDANAL